MSRRWVGEKLKARGTKIWQAHKYPHKKVDADHHRRMLEKYFPEKQK